MTGEFAEPFAPAARQLLVDDASAAPERLRFCERRYRKRPRRVLRGRRAVIEQDAVAAAEILRAHVAAIQRRDPAGSARTQLAVEQSAAERSASRRCA